MNPPQSSSLSTEPSRATSNAPLVVAAAAIAERTHRKPVAIAGQLIAERQRRVTSGQQLAHRMQACLDNCLNLQERLRPSISRPGWLSLWFTIFLKTVLVASELGAGTTTLYIGGEPLWLAFATFTGVALATVLAGGHIGSHFRRREEGETGSLLWLAIAIIVFGGIMLGLYRNLTVGPAFAVLAPVTVVVACGSAFLSYLWHDSVSEQLDRARKDCRRLDRAVDRELNHRAVRRFEKAESKLRPAVVAALARAHRQVLVPQPLVYGASAVPESELMVALDDDMVDRILVMLIGPEILDLVPKVSHDDVERADGPSGGAGLAA